MIFPKIYFGLAYITRLGLGIFFFLFIYTENVNLITDFSFKFFFLKVITNQISVILYPNAHCMYSCTFQYTVKKLIFCVSDYPR